MARSLRHFVAWLLLLFGHVSSAPFLLLSNNAAKCVQVEGPAAATLEILYEAPDLLLTEELPEEPEPPKQVDMSDIDSRFEDRHRRRMEAMKRAARRMKDTNILVMQRDPVGTMIGRRGHHYRNQKGTGRLREQIDKKSGVIEFIMSEEGGMVEVCVQALSASRQTPVRVSLRVRLKAKEPAVPQQAAPASGATDEQRLHFHSSRITNDLERMLSRVDEINVNADMARDRESGFFALSMSLHKAVKYWPMFRMAIVLAAGYFQVNHVVRYMKAKHIY